MFPNKDSQNNDPQPQITNHNSHTKYAEYPQPNIETKDTEPRNAKQERRKENTSRI